MAILSSTTFARLDKLVKNITAFTFLLAFAMQTFDKAIILFDYNINTSSYAKNCENKTRPQMHCNGNCQMMKRLKQEEKKEQQNPDRKASNKGEVTLSSKSYTVATPSVVSLTTVYFSFHSIGKEVKKSYSLLRPPIC